MANIRGGWKLWRNIWRGGKYLWRNVTRGRWGRFLPKIVWRHLWTAPNDIFKNLCEKTLSVLAQNQTEKSFGCQRRTSPFCNFVADIFISNTINETAEKFTTNLINCYDFCAFIKVKRCIKYTTAFVNKMTGNGDNLLHLLRLYVTGP